MLETRRAVLCALLDALLERKLLDAHTYEGARQRLYAATELPELFRETAQGVGETEHGGSA